MEASADHLRRDVGRLRRMHSHCNLNRQAPTYDHHNSYVDTLESRLEKMEGLLGRVSCFDGLLHHSL